MHIFSELLFLKIENCHLSDLSFIRNFQKLKKLNVAWNEVSSLEFLLGLKNLTILDVSNNNINSSDQLVFLRNMSLQQFVFTGNKMTEDSSFYSKMHYVLSSEGKRKQYLNPFSPRQLSKPEVLESTQKKLKRSQAGVQKVQETIRLTKSQINHVTIEIEHIMEMIASM